MNFSLPPISYPLQKNATFATESTPEVHIDREETNALQDVRNLPENKRSQYRMMISSEFVLIRQQIHTMRLQGKTDFAINLALDGLLKQSQAKTAEFLAKNRSWDDAKGRVINNLHVRTEGLKNLNSGLSPIKRIQFNDANDLLSEAGVVDFLSPVLKSTKICEAKPTLRLNEQAKQAQSFHSQLSAIRSQEVAQSSFQQKVEKKEARYGFKKPLTSLFQSKPAPIEKKEEISTSKSTPPKANESIYSSYQAHLKDKVAERAVTARVVASTLEVIGHVVKETAAVALGCRGEGRDNCKAVLKIVKKGTTQVRETMNVVATTIGAKPAIKRVLTGSALKSRVTELGLPPKSTGAWFDVNAEQYVRDSAMLAMEPILIGTASLGGRLAKSVFSSMNRADVKEFRIKDSSSTYSYTNREGHKVVVKEKHKTYYQAPEQKPVIGTNALKETARQANLKLLPRNTRTLPLQKKKLKLLPEPPNDIKNIDANKILREGRGIMQSPNANSNVASKTPIVTRMVVNGPIFQASDYPSKVTSNPTNGLPQGRDFAIKAAEILMAEKQAMGLVNIEGRFAQKQKKMQLAKQDESLLSNVLPVKVPDIFPKNITEFYKNSQSCGYFVYKSIGKDILFFIPSVKKIKSGSLEKSLKNAFSFAERNHYNRIFLTWDSLTHSLASIAENSNPIIGVGELSRGECNPLVLVEIKNTASALIQPQSKSLISPSVSAFRETYSFEMKETINSIDALLKKNELRVAGETIHKYTKTISDFFPDRTPLYKMYDNVQVWKHAIHTVFPEFSLEPLVTYFTGGDSIVVKISDSNRSFIVKEVGFDAGKRTISELKSLDFLRTLNLTYLEIPEPIAIGKYGNGEEEYHFIAKTFLENETFNSRMKTIGASPINSDARNSLAKNFVKDLYTCGKALGEYQSKGLLVPSTPEAQVMATEGYISEIGKQALCAHRLCDQLGIALPKNAYNLETIIKDYQKNPGSLSFGFIDHHGDQFLMSKSNKLGLFDAEMCVASFDGLHRPMVSTADELVAFVKMIDNEGILLGLTLEERLSMKNMIKQGYETEFKGTISNAATRLFEINAVFEIISTVAYHLITSETKDRALLQVLIYELNNIL